MSNYVWNKVYCDKETLEKYFIDYSPMGSDEKINEPYITFNRMFDVCSLNEYTENIGTGIYYGYGFSYKLVSENRYEIMFCTKWKYPIEAIKQVITLSRNTEWYAVEENCIYVSRFYWNDGVKEKIIHIEDDYNKWLDANIDFGDSLEDPDYDVWYYLKDASNEWIEWESNDEFKRYENSVCEIALPFSR